MNDDKCEFCKGTGKEPGEASCEWCLGTGAKAGQKLMTPPAEQHQGEPVCWVNSEQLLLCSKSPRHYEPDNPMLHNQPRNIAGSAVQGEYCNTPLFRNADPGEVERCEARLHEVASLCASVEQERDILRAQLAERDALLTRALPYLSNTPDLVQHGAEDLAEEIRSASAGRPCYGPNEWGTECGKCSKCKHASAEPSAPVERDELVNEDELRDMASIACQSALAHGVSEDWFMQLARSVERRARAALERKP